MFYRYFRFLLVLCLTFLAVALCNISSVAQPTWDKPIRNLMDRAVVQKKIPGAVLLVYDGATDQLLFQHISGRINPQQPLAIASATKWVTSATLMAMVSDGVLSLEETTGTRLGWKGDKGNITLAQLLSFTSGLNQGVLCLFNYNTTLEKCTDRVYKATNQTIPGASFEYGGTHLLVAGRMAEVAAQKSWATLFEAYMRRPLNLSADARFGGGTIGDRAALLKPTENPRLDGGLRLRIDDYVKFLRAMYKQGNINGKQIIRSDLVALMERSQFTPQTKIKYSPAALFPSKFEYGLGNWVECQGTQCDRQINSSLGAFGFYPWIDRQNGYYAVLAMEENKGATKSADLVFRARPLINQLVRRSKS